MYNTRLEFHSRGDDRPVCFSSAAVLDRSAGQHNSGLSYRTRTPRPHPYAVMLCRRLVKFDHVGGSVMACIHGATGQSSRWQSTQLSVWLSSDWDVSMSTCSTRCSYTAAVVRCAKTHGNHAAGREFDDISEANIHLWRHRKEPGGVTAVKNAAAWALLHFPCWNVSWLNSWKSNPMYNTHPKLYSKIFGK